MDRFDPMDPMDRYVHHLHRVLAAPLLALACGLAPAQSGVPAASLEGTAPAIANSTLDDRLFYQLLVAEMALTRGDAGSAYELFLDAARRTRDETLFRRATDIALQARAGEQALNATRAWRLTRPESADAMRLQLQILLLLNRPQAVAEPLRSLLAATPAAERAGLISVLPRFLQRAGDARQVVTLMEEALEPYREARELRIPVRLALGRAWLEAKEPARALALAREAQSLDPAAPGPALLGLELMRSEPAAESLVRAYLDRATAEPPLRLVYARVLTAGQRYADAVRELEAVVREDPANPQALLSLGALHLELRQLTQAETSLQRYLQLVPAVPAAPATPPLPAQAARGEDDDEPDAASPERGRTQALLMLAQAAEARGDFAAAERWLAQVPDMPRALDVQTRRSSILARQGRVREARELIRAVPERRPEDIRAKLLAEAGVLRDIKRWQEAFEVLAAANQRFSADPDLLYEQAMLAEKLDRIDEMERLLRRVIELRPDNAHAHNALGYSLADRRLRLPEARALIVRALELAPGDPFITDSLGWVEFRLGNRERALVLLREAYGKRPDTEIAAHLGEVLWSLGQRDEARRIWREGQVRDAANEVLRETLARLRVEL